MSFICPGVRQLQRGRGTVVWHVTTPIIAVSGVFLVGHVPTNLLVHLNYTIDFSISGNLLLSLFR